MTDDICIKCGESDWGIWTSSSTGKINRYCRCCRRKRAAKYTKRKKSNGGKHSLAEWKNLLSKTEKSSICNQTWSAIPKRPDKRSEDQTSELQSLMRNSYAVLCSNKK